MLGVLSPASSRSDHARAYMQNVPRVLPAPFERATLARRTQERGEPPAVSTVYERTCVHEPLVQQILSSRYHPYRGIDSFPAPSFTCAELWKGPCVEGDVGVVRTVLSTVCHCAVSCRCCFRSRISANRMRLEGRTPTTKPETGF